MLQTDKDSFICDMAETYHILNYESLPFDLLVTLANGLRENSRIKCKLAGIPIGMDTFFLAGVYDKVNWLAWSRSTASENADSAPKAILPMLLGIKDEVEKEITRYESGDDFEAAWRRLGGK